ncbi:MAG: hypothetical protein IPM98_19970 [Lewinellaceae bacterium]|nr:hypothetical protein [Lewinellaceae bacterium]
MHQFTLKWALCLLVLTSIGHTDLAGQVFVLRDTFCSNQFVIINGRKRLRQRRASQP